MILELTIALGFRVFQGVTPLPPLQRGSICGTYRSWTGFVFESLTLKRDGSFVHEISDDVIMPGEERTKRRKGGWATRSDEIILLFTNSKGWPKTIRYIPVLWDGSRMLVRSNWKQGFVEVVNEVRKANRKENIWFADLDLLKDSYPKHAFGPIQVPRRFLNAFSGIK